MGIKRRLQMIMMADEGERRAQVVLEVRNKTSLAYNGRMSYEFILLPTASMVC